MDQPNQNQTFLDWIKRFLKSNDIYGHPITLNYDNHETFQTSFGGFFSLTARTFIAIYFRMQLISVI